MGQSGTLAQGGAAETVTASGAECPACGFLNDMPYECLREHWQSLECGHCGEALLYQGRQVVEIVTRRAGAPL